MGTSEKATRRTSPAGRGGRPRKFAEPARPITVTLPERTLRQLAAVDPDRARAIARSADALAGDMAGAKPVEMVEIAPGTAILVVGPSRSLRRIPWLRLVEVGPTRFLLVVPSGTPVSSLEVAILDLLEDPLAGDPGERRILEELKRHLARVRRSDSLSKAELLFIATDRARR